MQDSRLNKLSDDEKQHRSHNSKCLVRRQQTVMTSNILLTAAMNDWWTCKRWSKGIRTDQDYKVLMD